jgi:hypothetical protein
MKVCLVEITNGEGETEGEVFASFNAFLQWLETDFEYTEEEVSEIQFQKEKQNNYINIGTSSRIHSFNIYPDYQVIKGQYNAE